MNKYQNAKIYKIVSNIHPLPYYGSTTMNLTRRLQLHESHHRTTNQKTSCYILFDVGDYEIQLVQNFPCNNRKELQEREDYYSKNYPCINKRRAYTANEEKKEKL